MVSQTSDGLIEYRGPSSRYLIRVSGVCTASRGTMKEVEAYKKRLLKNNIPENQIDIFERLNIQRQLK